MRVDAVMVCVSIGLWACSDAVPTGRRCQSEAGRCTPNAPSAMAGRAGDAASEPGTAGGAAGSTPAVTRRDDALSVHVEDIERMTIEIVTLACAGDCVEIEAVARGGNPPYTFTWDDGSTSAERRVCLDATQQLTVSATDTAIASPEFGYDAQTARTAITAEVLDCSDAGMPPPPSAELCVANPSIEGTPGMSEFGWMVPGWTPCQLTPDINPWLASTLPPSDGDTYLGVGPSEIASTSFCAPLRAGEPISFSVDLALTGASTVHGGIELWGATQSCGQDELLWSSPLVSVYESWTTLCGTFTPQLNGIEQLTLVPKAVDDSGAATYVLVDHFQAVAGCN